MQGAVGIARGGLRFGSNVRSYGLVESVKGIGYGVRQWATTYRGIGLTRGAIAEAQFGTVRGSPYVNYETHFATREISRLTWKVERSIARGGNNDIRSVQVLRRFQGTSAEPRFYGTAVNRVVDQALSQSADPLLSTTIIRQRAYGVNARGNAIFPDYRVPLGNQSVIDLTTVRQAGKARIYPAGNAIEPYTGTTRVPGLGHPLTPPSTDDDSASPGE